jgi:hypothetical protein
MLRRVSPVKNDVSDEHGTFIIRATRIDELGTMLAVTSSRATLRKIPEDAILYSNRRENLKSYKLFRFTGSKKILHVISVGIITFKTKGHCVFHMQYSVYLILLAAPHPAIYSSEMITICRKIMFRRSRGR